MAEGKRYFWLKLYDDFFGSMRIKKLRKMAGGDTFVIIYLKMQLKAMKHDGIIQFRGVEQDIVDELALDLDEEPDNVRITRAYLLSCGLAESNENLDLFLPYSVECVGSETASAQRVRDFRAKQKLLQCNSDVTEVKRSGNVEIEKKRDRDREEIEKKDRASRFTPPTKEEIRAYCAENGYDIDVDYFFDHYSGNGWKAGRVPMKDWKATVRNWYRRDQKEKKPVAKLKTPYDGIRAEVSTSDDLERLARNMGVNDG